METDKVESKKPRTEKQKAATAKALEALKARRQMTQEMIDEKMTKHVDEAEERIAAKVLARMNVIKPEEEEEPVVKKAIKKAVEVSEPKKKKVIVVEEESSSEEEVIIQRVKKTKAPAPVEVSKPAVPVRTTGNKLLDRMYGFC